MPVLAVWVACLALVFSPNAKSAGEDDALAVYKSADFERALPLLQAAVNASPNDEALNAALLSTLVYEGKVEAAADAASADEGKFPDSPVVVAARGEFAYYMGDMEAAEALFRQALKLKEQTARAYLGLYKLYEAASMYHTARLLILRAHAIDPDDALITRTWLSFIPPEQQRELFFSFAQSHPWLFKNLEIDRKLAQASEHVQKRRLFELQGAPQEVTLHLVPIYKPNHEFAALGVRVKLNNGPTLTLVLDTGASGILINHSAADKSGLALLGTVQATGIGDGGAQRATVALARSCQIETLHYENCAVRAAEGALHLTGDLDGLIGADLFSNYLVAIDFRKQLLHLVSLPPRPPNPDGYDAKKPEDGWTRVFRYGHLLFVPTNLNGKTSGLFLIDTGAVMSNVDSTFARLSTKIRDNTNMHIYGLSGSVNEVFRADKAVITFAGFRQKNIGLTSFNLNNSTEHHDVRIDGILGFSVLDLFRLTLDYRNGLVKFEYTRK